MCTQPNPHITQGYLWTRKKARTIKMAHFSFSTCPRSFQHPSNPIQSISYCIWHNQNAGSFLLPVQVAGPGTHPHIAGAARAMVGVHEKLQLAKFGADYRHTPIARHRGWEKGDLDPRQIAAVALQAQGIRPLEAPAGGGEALVETQELENLAEGVRDNLRGAGALDSEGGSIEQCTPIFVSYHISNIARAAAHKHRLPYYRPPQARLRPRVRRQPRRHRLQEPPRRV